MLAGGDAKALSTKARVPGRRQRQSQYLGYFLWEGPMYTVL
jgi:hypothetical protein